jgi:16S rRNA (adenine1518-N6/adenine1519-N6)-dimethyltransferase
MNLTDIKRALRAGDIPLTRSLGQNFLHDANQIRRIVETAELSGNQSVLEIGPGLGALTQSLLERAPTVLAIEKDQRLYDVLRQRFAGNPRLSLVRDDALEYLRREHADWSQWKLVSNLPYSVASPLLVELAHSAHPPIGMTVTVQLEVAQRIAAQAGGKEYGVLTLLLQLKYEARIAFKLPASCFFPAPNVDSACVSLRRRERLPLDSDQSRSFAKIVKRGFSERRKMMMKLLKADWPLPKLEHAFAELRIQAGARAETVSLAQFIRLTELLTSGEPRLS